MLLESVEGLGHSPFVTDPGEVWEALQAEREDVNRQLLAIGRMSGGKWIGLLESEASEEYARQMESEHRNHLETRFREITDAQDRLMDGTFGRCVDCGEEIARQRLLADLAASLCAACQRRIEIAQTLEELFETDSVY
jgi:RNA polymerase-binding transcription factor DksA